MLDGREEVNDDAQKKGRLQTCRDGRVRDLGMSIEL